MHRSFAIVALAASGLFASSTRASGDTLTVCASGCQYTSINAAINDASDGDVIQLSAETYFEGEQIDTLGKAITLRGSTDKAGDPASVLDGWGANGKPWLAHRVLICQSGETNATIFENLAIQSGAEEIGGGMYNKYSSPTLTDCNFGGNANPSGYGSIAGDPINGRSSGNNLLEARCVLGDINFDGDYDEDDARAAMADFGITEGTPGDMDGDDDVDAADFVAVRDRIGVDALGCLVADINGDGQVGGADFAYVLGYWGLCSAP